jgi:hypothetical protein
MQHEGNPPTEGEGEGHADSEVEDGGDEMEFEEFLFNLLSEWQDTGVPTDLGEEFNELMGKVAAGLEKQQQAIRELARAVTLLADKVKPK